MEERGEKKFGQNILEFWWVRIILLFAPLCKVLHGRACHSLGEPYDKSEKITNTLRFVFICATVCATRIIGVWAIIREILLVEITLKNRGGDSKYVVSSRLVRIN